MSWYTVPSAEYVILRVSDKSLHAPNTTRPCDIRNQLVGAKVGTKEPFNEVRYISSQRTFFYEVIEISTNKRTQSDNEVALISRTTQIFVTNLEKWECKDIFCFSPQERSWELLCPYSEEDFLLALQLHDPTVVSSLLGDLNNLYHFLGIHSLFLLSIIMTSTSWKPLSSEVDMISRLQL